MTLLEQLKTIKLSAKRNVKFWLEGCDDNLDTTISDGSYALKNELIDILLDKAIKYLEDKE